MRGVIFGPFRLEGSSKGSSRTKWSVSFNPGRAAHFRDMKDPRTLKPSDHTWADYAGKERDVEVRTDVETEPC